MSDIVLKDKNGIKNTYSGYDVIKIADSDGYYNNYVAEPMGTKTIKANGIYDVSKVKDADVQVPSVAEPVLIEKSITNNGTYNASDEGADGYSKVTVNVASGGGSTECDGCIIEVDTLPTENIDENALYKCGDSYYTYSLEFKDLVLAYNGNTDSYIKMMEEAGNSIELYYAKTRPTDNIKISTSEILHIYYVEDEDDILAYGDFEGSGTNAWMSLSADMPYGGAITDVSQITTTDYMLYALVDNGWKEYLAPEGKITIVANGTFDVTDKAEVTVNVETVLQEKTVTENGEVTADDGYDGLSKVIVNVPQPSGELNITENGTYDVRDKASVTVAVEGGSESVDLTEIDTLIGDGLPTIRAGTYRWKDPLDAFSLLPIGTHFALNFTVSPQFSLTSDGFCPDDEYVSFTGAEILSGKEYGVEKVLAYYNSSNTSYVYSNEYGWDTYYTYNYLMWSQYGYNVDPSAKGWGRTFTVTEDIETTDDFLSLFQASTERITEESATDPIKSKIQSLIDKANATTDKDDTDLTTAVLSLVDECEQNVVKYGNFLTFSSPSKFTLKQYTTDGTHEKTWNGTIEYSYDAINWTEWTGEYLIVDTVLYLRGVDNTYITGQLYRHWIFDGTGISCDGNIETLLDYNTVANGNHPVMAEMCFARLFRGNLIKAPELPATTLETGCYAFMFSGCTSLTSSPALPATTLAESCYYCMFQNCTSLISTPALPATTLAKACYRAMFIRCTSLTSSPALPATTLAEQCYAAMFDGCTSLTVISMLPIVQSLVLDLNCCARMYADCTSLKLSTIQAYEHQPEFVIYGIPVGDSLGYMFSGTSGDFTGTPTEGTVYYLTDNAVIRV